MPKLKLEDLITADLTLDLNPFVRNPDLAKPANHEDVQMDIRTDTLTLVCDQPFNIVQIDEIDRGKDNPPKLVKNDCRGPDSPFHWDPPRESVPGSGTNQMFAGRAQRSGRFMMTFVVSPKRGRRKTVDGLKGVSGHTLKALDPCVDIGPPW